MGVERVYQVRLYSSQSPFADGRVMVCGAKLKAQQLTEIYDPLTNSWTPAALMGGERRAHSQSTLLDGRVLVCGGQEVCGGGDEEGFYSKKTEIYTPATDTWTQAAPMGRKRRGHSQSTLIDGRVLVCGGCDGDYGNPTNTTEI
eukprot:GHVN01086720.1.p1 GENE.GHVN01086720.1~~GHVN01086720.1.p1  ORF type:complete len:144 (-),score=29.46 GHVN01086720.1:360-791(-)